MECYKKVPKSVLRRKLGEKSVDKWQSDWDQTTKEQIKKEYSPIVADRLIMKINITHNFTSVVIGHGNIRSYLQRFKIQETPNSSYGTKNQIIDNLLYECGMVNKERNGLIPTVIQTDFWTITKRTSIKKYFKIFVKYTNEISFDKHDEVSIPPNQQNKKTSKCATINVIVSKHSDCKYNIKARTITMSNGACNNKKINS
jgi:hypothetical protein